MLNNITIMGRLTAAPELKMTNSGVSVCSVTLAVERDFPDRNTGERVADFIDVVLWRSAAEFVEKFFSKGDMLCVVGSLQSRKWQDKNGNNRVSWEVQAEKAHFCGQKAAAGAAPAHKPVDPVVADKPSDGYASVDLSPGERVPF